jgi:hypothetical protein
MAVATDTPIDRFWREEPELASYLRIEERRARGLDEREDNPQAVPQP